MANKIRALFLILLAGSPVLGSPVLDAPVLAAAEDEAPRYLQRLSWEKVEFAAYYELTVEIEQEAGVWKPNLQRRLEESEIDLRLAPGRYRFCVQAFNSPDTGSEAPEWLLFDVQPKISAPANPETTETRHYSFGLGAELNTNAETDGSVGANISGEKGINAYFALGLRAGVSYDFRSFSTVEPEFFLRWYALALGTRAKLFIQADSGLSIIMADDKTTGVFLCGLAAGLRVTFGHLYIEPYARGGWPFLWGAGLALGWTRE
jgi:hypothetical protein